MTDRNINHDIWTKAHRQIDPTVLMLDRSLESLDRECFEDTRSADVEQNIKIDDEELNVRTVKNEDIEEEFRYACAGCNFRSHDKLPVSIHQMIQHRDELYRTIGIGCEACEDGELHAHCDFGKHIKSQHMTDKLDMQPLAYLNGTSTARESKDFVQLLKNNMNVHVERKCESKEFIKCDKCEFKTKKAPYIKNHRIAVHGKCAVATQVKKCLLCEFETLHKTALINHIGETHMMIKNFACGECGFKSFARKKITTHIFKKHPRLHVNVESLNPEVLMPKVKVETFLKKEKLNNLNKKLNKKEINVTVKVKDVKQKIRNEKLDIKNENINKTEEFRLGVRSLDKKEEDRNIKIEKLYKKTVRSRAPKIAKKSPTTFKQFECDFCPFSGEVAKKDIVSHMRTEHPQEKLFTCESCPYKVNYMPNLNTHRNAIHNKKVFKCLRCGWATTWKNSFSEHMRFKHGVFHKNSKYKNDWEISESVCDMCGFSATSELSMKLHKKSQCDMKTDRRANRRESIQGGKNCNCTLCGQEFQSKNGLERHKRTKHEGIKFSCDQCNYKAAGIYSVRQHKEFIHEGVKYQCDQCLYQAPSRKLLQKHVEEVHEGVKYKCNQCDHESTRRSSLRRHKKTAHEGVKYQCDRRHQCSKCDYSANHRRFLKCHETLNHSSEAVSKEEIVKCALCDFETDSNVKLVRHNREAHDKENNYSCSLCGKTTFRRNSLVRHISFRHANTEAKCIFIGSKNSREQIQKVELNHTLVKIQSQGVKYHCDQCLYEAPSRKLLQKHIEAVHEGLKYKCAQCDHKSSRSSGLWIHKKAVHEGVRYQCDLCPLKFNQKTHLKTHKKALHKDATSDLSMMLHTTSQYDMKTYLRKKRIELMVNASRAKLMTKMRGKRKDIKGEIKKKMPWICRQVRHKCNQCDYTTMYARLLKNHKILNHVTKALSNESLLLDFKTEAKEQWFINRNESHNKDYSCIFSEQNLQNKNYLKTIKLPKHEGTKFLCDQCDYKAARFSSVKQHKEYVHEGVKYHCDQCLYEGSNTRQLKKHIDGVHDGVKYKCDQCDHESNRRTSLYRHKKTVHEGVRYQCDLCSLKFNQKPHLKTHKKALHKDANNGFKRVYFKNIMKEI